MSLFRYAASAALAASLAAALSAWAGGASAEDLPNYVLDMTETHAGLNVHTNLPTLNSFPDDGFSANGTPGQPDSFMFFGPTDGGYAEFFPQSNAPGSDAYSGLAWRDPGVSNAYNLLFISPSGNRGNVNFTVVSDVAAAELGNIGGTGANFFATCRDGTGFIACPVLNNGDTFTMQISLFATPLGSLAVTYNDQDGLGGVPEPAAWALMISGFGLAGTTLRLRRRRRLA